VLTAHFDESYNKQCFCVGGWLASDDDWSNIGRQWRKEIKRASQMSVRNGLRTIKRFHASDCATFGGDFRGWDQTRQVALMQKLTGMIGTNKPIGFVVSAQLGDFVRGYPGHEEERHKACYFFCLLNCFLLIGDFMHEHFPEERVTIIYDRGKISEAGAPLAFSSMKNDKAWEPRKYFVTSAPMGWERCTPLEVADLLAYEGFKYTINAKIGSIEMRRSLQQIVGSGVTIYSQSYKSDAFEKLSAVQKIMNAAQTNPTLDLRKIMSLTKTALAHGQLPTLQRFVGPGRFKIPTK
jgi:hypothetical protein